MIVCGKVWKLGDNIDTDLIIGGQYLSNTDPDDLARHCFESLEPNWAEKIARGDIIVAGSNFGCGSSREHAVMALKASGISCIVADSYSAIFFRNAINLGLPAIELKGFTHNFQEGDIVKVDIHSGIISNETAKKEYRLSYQLPPIILQILQSGGLLAYLSKCIK
jgi:3-isopropylmalate/(R)-2-methylmalate dehydratase small subunit